MVQIILKRYFLFVVLITTANLSLARSNMDEQHLKVVLRMVGHQFLLQMGDSTSIVLPVKKIGEQYRIQLEEELPVEPDKLSFSIKKVFEENYVTSGYIMEVVQCETSEMVYSLEYDPLKEIEVIPCRARLLPKDCYQIFFTFLDEAREQDQPKAVKSKNNSIIYLIIGLVMLLVVTVYFRKKKKPVAPNVRLLKIGTYQFDKDRMKLFNNGKGEELSSKEANLLELLVLNENKTLEREYILNVVWNDEGDYVGRTLDVSISKLRKKLNADPNIKIINIRGIGYRFTVG